MFHGKHDLTYDGRRSTIGIDAKYMANSQKRSADLKFILTCPYADNVILNFDHEHSVRDFRLCKTNGLFQWKNNKKIELKQEASFVSGNSLTKDVEIKTPFRGYERITLVTNAQRRGQTWTSSSEIAWGRNKITSDKVLKIMNNWQFDYDWKLTTPFPEVRRFNAAVKNVNNNGVWKTDVEGQLNTDKVEVSSEVKLAGPMMVRLDVKSPWREMRNLRAEWDFTGRPRDFTTSASLSHNLLDGPVRASLQLDTERLQDIKGEFSLDTPFDAAKKVKSMMSHKRQGNKYMTDASLEIPRYKGTVSHEFMYRNPTNWRSTLEVEYKPGQKIITIQEFIMNRQVTKGQLSLETPFDVARMYKVQFNHKGEPTDFETTVDVTYAPSKTIATEVNFKMVRDKIQGALEVTSPFKQLRKASVSFEHEGGLSNSVQTIKANINGQKYSASHDISTNLRNYMYQCTTKIKTPHAGWQDIELRVKHDGPPTDFKTDVEIDYDDKSINSHLEYEYDDTGVKGKFEFRSPCPFLENIKLELDHSGNMRSFRNSGAVEYNGRRYSGNTRYGRNQRGHSAAAAVSMPEEYGFTFDHEGDAQDMSSRVEFTLDRKKTNLEAKYKNDGSNLETTFSVRSPYRNYERAQVSLNHRNTRSGFTTTGDVESSYPGYDRINFELSQDRKAKGMKTTGFVRTPFKILPTANFDVSHTGDMDDFRSEASLELDDKKYSGNVNYKNDRSGLETGFDLKTPFESFETQGLKIAHRNTRQGFKSSASLDTSYPGYKNFGTQVSHKGGWKNFESSVRIDTPFRQMPSSVVSIAHSGEPSDFSTTIKTEYNGNTIEGTVNLKKIGGWWETDHEAAISFSTPYDFLRDFEMKTEHKNQGRQSTGKIEVTHNGEKKLDADYTRRGGNRKSLEMNMRSPRPVSVSGTMDTTNGEFNGEASVNWDPRSRNKNVRFEYGLKTQDNDCRLKFKTMLPNRDVGIDTGYTSTDNSFTHDLTFQWDKDDRSKVSYTIEGSYSERRRQKITDWKVDASTPYGPLKVTLNNQKLPNRCVTEVEIEGTDKLTVKNELFMRRPNFEDFVITTTVKHPRMRRVRRGAMGLLFLCGLTRTKSKIVHVYLQDAVLKIEGVMQPQPFKWDGSVNLQYSTQNFAFSGKLADESVGLNSKYVAEMKASHPNSFLDFDFKSVAEDSRESVGGNMQVKYQTASNRQVKTLSLKTQVNKLRDEFSLEVSDQDSSLRNNTS